MAGANFSLRSLRLFPVALLALALAACGGGVHYRPVSDTPVRIGPPYTVRGTTYVPAADPSYDAVGYASWYGSASGHQTANGEKFRPDGVSAAHTTLPLPSYAEVTDLDTGRTILVRINDRGPFSGRGRIIDLSEGAAQQLGIRRKGIAPVRVRAVEPPNKDRKRLRDGKEAVERPRMSRRELAEWRARLGL
ncbi:septal ring lytic transglycosylase RlpA family protein [Altericroceibacterium spongiae]|uniref:Endolytic peptidoglycan transglycosylase RlpA n=1 Tax=Altericroceibacterium spongiae TaxID=2320269 RepID=A0A420EJW2_9SPHN|nr:septal ring lytic transglycosylase RlpA family protein [Altericroceibacterium spongiae]RKF20975.1 septal ring lytic transglycosylase RlpA family protein [Altericroceibacterium spongiae]